MVKELKACCCSYSKALGVYICMCFEACSIICILQSLQISRKCLLGTTIKVRTHFVKLLCKPLSVSGNSMVWFCQGCNFINTIFVLSTYCKMVGLFYSTLVFGCPLVQFYILFNGFVTLLFLANFV